MNVGVGRKDLPLFCKVGVGRKEGGVHLQRWGSIAKVG